MSSFPMHGGPLDGRTFTHDCKDPGCDGATVLNEDTGERYQYRYVWEAGEIVAAEFAGAIE